MTTAWTKVQISELRHVMGKLAQVSGQGTYLLMETSKQAEDFFGPNNYLRPPCIVTERKMDGRRHRPMVTIKVRSNLHSMSFPRPDQDKRVDSITLTCDVPYEARRYGAKNMGRTFKRLKKTGEYNIEKLHEAVTKFTAEVDKALAKAAQQKSDAELGIEVVEKALKHAGLPCSPVKDYLDLATRSIETEVGGYKIVLNVASEGFVAIGGQRLPSFPAMNAGEVAKAYAQLMSMIEADTVA